jgi:hypothetical protein
VRNTTFDELPQELRDAVAAHTGGFGEFTSATVGNHAEVAGALRTGSDQIFIKGTRLIPDEHWGGAEAWSLRNEAAVLPFVKPYAPELLWQIEAAGWLLLGFEYIDGRHADYAPGSPDLDAVADVIDGLEAVECPATVRMRVEQRYTALSDDAAVLAGSSLLHCDLNPANVLITRGGAQVVDWAFASRGAAWLEYGYLLPWMLRDGHTPGQAETWMTRFPIWKDADPGDVAMFAGFLARQWSRRDMDGAEPWVREYAALVSKWAEHRSKVRARKTAVQPAPDWLARCVL